MCKVRPLSQGLHEPSGKEGAAAELLTDFRISSRGSEVPSSYQAKEPPGREPQRGSRLPTSRDLLAGQSHPSSHISRGHGSIGGSGFTGKMEYPAFGTVPATDSGGVQPYNSSEEPEGREPDGLRFDRERACRLWEAVSGAQPVGREEGE